ncbi:Heparinase II/III-like protein [Cyclonatronum proteinivorum]|uniref:Heparinase II/III-like protein n=2 Tax=Cyclonatronum proteinivorum TaxID=1457365 RepID=A0A345UMM1_9BACT|nr:Heparinase II/III-like protein [Cyclonatronum proteinivorum]
MLLRHIKRAIAHPTDLLRVLMREKHKRIGHLRCSYTVLPGRSAETLLGENPLQNVTLPESTVPKAYTQALIQHQFTILGSGTQQQRYGMPCQGFEDFQYESAADIPSPEMQVNPSNRKRAAYVRQLIADDTYEPIDWQLDFRSGYRWRASQNAKTIPIVSGKGYDIKVPWELARLQHLPAMLLQDAPDKLKSRQEAVHQLLDFIAANPPGFGVNWVSTMDVAIRAANMVLSLWLIEKDGTLLPEPVRKVIACSLVDHGKWVKAFPLLQKGRGNNHLLSDYAGMAFIARALHGYAAAPKWQQWALEGLLTHCGYQFNADGSNFEGSVNYHRLSTEIVVWGLAALSPRMVHTDTRFTGLVSKLARASEILRTLRRPDGCLPSFGETDSGRFFNLNPRLVALDRETTSGVLLKPQMQDFMSDTQWLEAKNDPAETLAVSEALLFGYRQGPAAAIIAALMQSEALLPDQKACYAGFETVSPVEESSAEPLPLYPQQEWKISEDCTGTALSCVKCSGLGLILIRGRDLWLLVRLPMQSPEAMVHQEYDALAFELWAEGELLVPEPGTYVYTPHPSLRKQYKSAAAHGLPPFDVSDDAALWDKGGNIRRRQTGHFRWEQRAEEIRLYLDLPEAPGLTPPLQRCFRFTEGTLQVSGSWETGAKTEAATPARAYGELAKATKWLDFRQLEKLSRAY